VKKSNHIKALAFLCSIKERLLGTKGYYIFQELKMPLKFFQKHRPKSEIVINLPQETEIIHLYYF